MKTKEGMPRAKSLRQARFLEKKRKIPQKKMEKDLQFRKKSRIIIDKYTPLRATPLRAKGQYVLGGEIKHPASFG